MSKFSVQDVANSINEHCEKNDLMFAGGLLIETFSLWKNQEYRNLLCETAQIMFSQVNVDEDYKKQKGL